MSDYKGQFHVGNNSGAAITQVTVTHTANDVSSTSSAARVGPYEYTPVVGFQTSPSAKDYWAISFVDGDGHQRTGNATCAYKSEDSDKLVQIRLNGHNWDAVMPVSSSCDNKSYN